MKCNSYVCDVCGKHVSRYECIVRLKARSGKFITYANMEDWFSDRKNVDVCLGCIEDIKAFVKNRRRAENAAD